MSERDEFEAWAKSEGCDMAPVFLGTRDYYFDCTEQAWKGWKASTNRATTQQAAVPIGWYEAEPSFRGADLRKMVRWPGPMLHSGRWHWRAERPETSNPVWPVYAAPKPVEAAPVLTDEVYNLVMHAAMYLSEGEPDNAKRALADVLALYAAPQPSPEKAPQRYQD